MTLSPDALLADAPAGSTVLRGPDLAELPVVDFFAQPSRVHGSIDRHQVTALDITRPATPATPGEPEPEPLPGTTPEASEAELEAAYERGREDGLAAATSETDAEIAAREALAAAVAELRTAIEEQRSATDELAVELAIEIARLILAREVSAAANPGRDALVRCLADTDATAVATVHLNPADLTALGDIDDLTVGRSVELVADPSVESGDAVAEVSGGRVNASLADALHRVARVLGS